MNKYLYFLRHATAEVIRPNQLDIDRCLVEKGRLQARRVARFMQRHNIEPDIVLSSPYPRAIQTAAIVCKEAALAPAKEQDWLALATDSQSASSQLYQQLPELPQHSLLVGHEPDISALISLLLGCHQPALKIRKASLTCLTYGEVSKSFQLEWLVPAKLM
ncbi:SixA phosphatase family protein [Arsukibacterium indicum]|uniref:Histidine phosphatase family protein n=1 Tax=Arsukibacterium indicum TaxID=2848612 RepID=A0ABS6MPV9_9GAMM|nr:histidine phosphatase family protein [Arsukibacterium indicum]MBV2130765.1 histidine phosphatase family protein [Arsukibacterium indicum]